MAKGFGYLRFAISGSVTDPTAAVSALAEPQIPEKNIVERIATMPIAPRIFPTKSMARLTMRVAIPPRPMMVPARMKSGIASSGKESKPASTRCGKMMRKSGESQRIPASAAMPSAIPIGTEKASVRTRVTAITSPMDGFRLRG